MNSKAIPLAATAAAFLVALAASGSTIWHVAENGNDATGDGSPGAPFATPGRALFFAADGDTVIVGDGTYFNATACDIIVTNAVTLKSENGPASTILDGNAATVVGANYIYGAQNGSSYYRWVMEVRNANAVVSGFTMQGGYIYNPSTTSASGLQLYAGTVTNCVIRYNRGGNQNTSIGGAGAYVNGGTLVDCEIYGNAVRYNNNSTGVGGGVLLVSGLVESCVITNNSAGANGGGVAMRGGTLRNCLVADNHGHYLSATQGNNTSGNGGGIYMADGAGLVENCVIRDNTRYLRNTAGVYVNHSGAILRNSLIVNNTALQTCGGVQLANGRVENCTIAGNVSRLNGTDGVGFRQTNGTALNNIIYGNETTVGAVGAVVTKGTFKTNLVETALSSFTAGDGNLAANPLFRDAANGDYSLKFGSPAIDAANPNAAIAKDLDGVARPQGEASDIGCYEYVPSGAIACAFDATAATYLDSASPTFTASVVDAAGDVSYAWYLDGVLQTGLTGATATFADLGYGRHSVKLVVSDGVSTAEFEAEDVVSVAASTAYVSTTGSNTYPYETAAKAATSLQDALEAVYATDETPGTVIVAPSTYRPYDFYFSLTKPVHLVSSDGPETTVLCADNSGFSSDAQRVINVENAKAILEGFTLTGGNWYSASGVALGPGGLYLASGTVTNCVIRGNRGDSNGQTGSNAGGGGAKVAGGLLIDSVITNNYSRYNSDSTGTGGGVLVTGGEVARCLIRGNRAGLTTAAGCGAHVTGGVLRDSIIDGNYTLSAGRAGGGVFLTGGTVERCVISNNFGSASTSIPKNGGGVYMTGGTLRNCLVVANQATDNGGGIYQTGGTAEFCTVADNASTKLAGSGLYMNGSEAVARYNILYRNGGGTSSEAGCNVTLSSYASLATNVMDHATSGLGTDNIYGAPLFADRANGDYTLSVGSAAIDGAAGVDWVADDLAGNARPEDGNGDGTAICDIGCYEAPDASSGALACSFSPDSVSGVGENTFVFAAAASGAGSDGDLAYSWTAQGASSTEVSADGATLTATWTAPGIYAVSLTVTAEGGATASASVSDCVKIGVTRIYVDASNENPEWPYNTWETAANDFTEAIGSLVIDPTQPITVTVTNGTYSIADSVITMSYPIRIESLEGPEETTIVAAYSDSAARHHFYLTHADAILSGFTLTGANADSWTTDDYGASSLRISAGVVSNCVVSGAYTARSGYGAVEVSGTGLLTHSAIQNCFASRDSSSGSIVYGAGVRVSDGGIAEHCTITGCHTHGATGSGGGGAYVLDGGILRDCEVLDCYAYGTANGTVVGYGGAILQTGGTVERCIIGDTTTETGGGEAVRVTGGEMANCLIRGAVADGTSQQALYLSSGRVLNCTIVTNGFGSAASSPVAAAVMGGTLANCAFAFNNGGDVAQDGGTVSHSIFGEADGVDGNLALDPQLVPPESATAGRPAYSPLPGSSCINAGEGSFWNSLAGVTDIAGNARKFGGAVDVGCYEWVSLATILFMR